MITKTIQGPGKTLIQGELIETLPDGSIKIKVNDKTVVGQPVNEGVDNLKAHGPVGVRMADDWVGA